MKPRDEGSKEREREGEIEKGVNDKHTRRAKMRQTEGKKERVWASLRKRKTIFAR
jgi:hypothetical protein